MSNRLMPFTPEFTLTQHVLRRIITIGRTRGFPYVARINKKRIAKTRQKVRVQNVLASVHVEGGSLTMERTFESYGRVPSGAFFPGTNVMLLALSLGLALVSQSATAQPGIRSQVTDLWSAESSEGRATAARAIIDAEYSFSEAFQALRAGPEYRADVKTGRIERLHDIAGVRHPYFFVVPDDYDPSKRYPVRFFLHGGVRRPAWDSGGQWWSQWQRVSAPGHIAVFPASWAESPWWSGQQIDNVAAILTDIKREYNVDENRVTMFGVSDGGSGAYLYAFRDATRWAAFLPFIGHPAVLSNPRISLDELYLTNLTGRPFYIVNAENDRLYPVPTMRTFLTAFRWAGVEFEFRAQPGGHGVTWWPAEAPRIERFIDAHPRIPLPDTLSWETERIDRYNRFHWVRIDAVDSTAAVLAPLADPFPHEHPAGRIDVRRNENEITVTTRDVVAFTLLLSPEMFDFANPLRVVANGNVVFDSTIEPDVDTLVTWAAQDLDRTMLFGAELSVVVSGAKPDR